LPGRLKRKAVRFDCNGVSGLALLACKAPAVSWQALQIFTPNCSEVALGQPNTDSQLPSALLRRVVPYFPHQCIWFIDLQIFSIAANASMARKNLQMFEFFL
jgi:hypothetical protein